MPRDWHAPRLPNEATLEPLARLGAESVNGESGPLRVVSYAQTCLAVPSQWEGTLEDGRMFYVRFRNGSFRVSVSPSPTTDPMDAVRGAPLVEELIDASEDDGYDDGYMEESEMLQRTAALLDFRGSTRLEADD